jgi:hypothetical protein
MLLLLLLLLLHFEMVDAARRDPLPSPPDMQAIKF